ncbi:MAG TPA: sugar porter family MFS transporter [Acidobacteriaceae bacterium]|nr:sugar porter family MFS transporter [Acidobacteriaceae bacterium]
MIYDSAPPSPSVSAANSELRLGYLWTIAFVAALGGLLFGYDWVVIGGAKPFYEAYFHLTSDVLVGWANSCALAGCFLGSLLAGPFTDRFGRRRVLLLSALLFAVSSLGTGWAYTFTAFVAWRIGGGLAIGIASIVSPMYTAEISPAAWRGRLVSVNQLALVTGILAAQIANWVIARPVPSGLHGAALAGSWNAQYGWRWMFSVVAVPALVLLAAAPFIPESPRWLVTRYRDQEATEVLRSLGGHKYAREELQSIQQVSATHRDQAKWRELLSQPGRKLLIIGIALAVLQQGSGINILFNYAQEVYHSAGYGLSGIMLNIVITGAINLVFTLAAMLMVDRIGRRPLMIFGCFAVGASHLAAGIAYHVHLGGIWVLVLTLCAIACYAMSLAPVTWVLITEIFPNRMRASAVSISVAALWVASFLLTYTFPWLNRRIGTSGAFLLYASICFAGALFVFGVVPETKGRSLEVLEHSIS